MNIISQNPSASVGDDVAFFSPEVFYRANPRSEARSVPTMPPSKPLDDLAGIALVLAILGGGIAGWYGFWCAILWLIAHV